MGSIQILSREFYRLAAREGSFVAVMLFPLLLWRRLCAVNRRPQQERDPSGGVFDAHYGVETGGVIPATHLDVSQRIWIHSFGYQGVVPDELEALWPSLDIDYPKTVFIDFGAGKGRALMLAAKRPFKGVIGVEITPELCVTAKANLKVFEGHNDCCAPAEVLCSDASSYELPSDPLVLFLYNPFGTPVMEQVTANLSGSLRSYPRRAVVIYIRPELAELWDLMPEFSLVSSGARLRIYDNRSQLESSMPTELM